MFDTHQLYRQLSKQLDPVVAETLATALGAVYSELKETVTKSDFRELIAAQNQTDETVKQLVEAQKRTETRVEDLAEAQKRTETRVGELVEAQKRTETRIGELAEAQRRTVQTLKTLAEAQRQTEETVRKLVDGQARLEEGQREIRRDLGALQQTFSYAFENEAYRMLPGLLASRFDFQTHDRLLREYIGDVEINFLAKGEVQGRPTLLVGESKHRVRPQDIDACIGQIDSHVEAVRSAYGDLPVLRIIVTHAAHPRAIEVLAARDVHVIQSHEW